MFGKKKIDIDEKAWQGPRAETFGPTATPEERAEGVVRRLEQFIRENRTVDGGMNFRKWQEMAFVEITDAIRDSENIWRRDQRFMDRFFMVGAAALVTVGMWGTAMAVDYAPDRQTAGLYLTAAGAVLFALLGLWGIRRLNRYYRAGARRRLFHRVRSLEARLRALDRHLEKRVEGLEDAIEEMAVTEARVARKRQG